MERELILTIKNSEDSIENEIECLKTMFPYLESFEAFKACNEVFDMKKHLTVYAKPKLKMIFQGVHDSENHFIISLN